MSMDNLKHHVENPNLTVQQRQEGGYPLKVAYQTLRKAIEGHADTITYSNEQAIFAFKGKTLYVLPFPHGWMAASRDGMRSVIQNDQIVNKYIEIVTDEPDLFICRVREEVDENQTPQWRE